MAAIPEDIVPTADVVLFGDADGDLHVLLIRRRYDPFKGQWALPGGHVDSGETSRAAAHRELTEETGLSVGRLTPVGNYAKRGRDPRGRYATDAFTARLPGPVGLPAPTAGDDAAEAFWLSLDDALAGDGKRLAFDHARIIRDALEFVV